MEGRCQLLSQPRVPHLGNAFFFFPAVFAPVFALVSLGKPQPCGHGTLTVPSEERKAHPCTRRISQCLSSL